MIYASKSLAKQDIYNENYNHYFTEIINGLTEEQSLNIPYDLHYKIFKSGTVASAERLNFNEKLWLLEVVFNKSVVITVSDNVNGLSIIDYEASIKAQKAKITNGALLEQMRTKGAFALGGKELMASLLYMSHVDCTGIYQLIKTHVPNAEHKRNTQHAEKRIQFNKVVEFLTRYEANKRRISMTYKLNVPEWYALLYFVTERYARDFYNKDFTYSYNSSSINLHKALKRVYSMGLLNRKRVVKKDKYVISAKGMDILGRIFDNVLLNY